MPKGFVYILECSIGTLYTGSTIDLKRRLRQHFSGQGANHTKKYPPVELIYVEEFERIDTAFYREKQIQRWSHSKKRALAEKRMKDLHDLSICMNQTHYKIQAFLEEE